MNIRSLNHVMVIGESCTYGLWVCYEGRNNFIFSLANFVSYVKARWANKVCVSVCACVCVCVLHVCMCLCNTYKTFLGKFIYPYLRNGDVDYKFCNSIIEV